MSDRVSVIALCKHVIDPSFVLVGILTGPGVRFSSDNCRKGPEVQHTLLVIM